MRYETFVRKNGTETFTASNVFETKTWAKDWVRNGTKHDAGFVVDKFSHEIIYQWNCKDYVESLI